MAFTVRAEHYSSERKIKNKVPSFASALKLQEKLKRKGYDSIVISKSNPPTKKSNTFYMVMASVTIFLMYQKYRNQNSVLTQPLQALSTAAGVATALEWLRIL